MRQPESKRAITRTQYDAVLLDMDGVITDTANLHAACWKQMFDEYLEKRAAERGEAFSSLRSSPRTTGPTWMETPDTMAFATFSHHAESNSPRATRRTPRRPTQCAGSGTARTIWSTRVIEGSGGGAV